MCSPCSVIDMTMEANPFFDQMVDMMETRYFLDHME